jgi:RNA polymerase sigma-70 factor (ECF subfamily)
MDGTVERLMEHRAEFLGYLRKHGATVQQAEDLFQSSLVRGLEPWTAPPSVDALVPWFYRVLRNALIDQTRRSAAAGRALDRYANQLLDEELPAEPRRVCMCTHTVLASLKPEYAQLIRAVDLDGAPIEHAAQNAGITPNNAYVRLHRARKALRDRLEAMCGTCATGGGQCSDCYCQPTKSAV